VSLDLFERESNEQIGRLTPVMQPEVGFWDGFMRGTAMHTMRGLAKTGRAIDLLGSVGPIAQDAFTGGTTAQDRYFREHDEVWGAAVDAWTPKPLEVGAAAEIAGALISTLPLILASPGLAIGATQLGTAEDLVQKGVDSTKAQAVGAVQAAGLGLGIYMPIFGKTLMQRVLAGGVGFNVAQGVAMRGASGMILEGTPAAGDFKAFDATALTLDAILGAAFGGIVHLSPTQRAEGARMWERMEGWGKTLKPSDVDALTTLRQAQHLNVDSLPGRPAEPVDLDRHVQRLREALEQTARDQPVEVSDMPAGNFTVDEARQAQAMENGRILAEAAEEVRVAEGMPAPPRLDIPLNQGLSPEQAAVEAAVRERVLADVDGFIEAYKKLPGTENGKIINTDEARELFEEYRNDRSTHFPSVHEPASALMKEYYSRVLAQPDPEGLNMVTFTGGGTGAGKSTARGSVRLASEIVDASQYLYDTNMAGTRSAINKIDLALAHGKQVNILFVGTDPIEAFRRSLTRAMRMGRTVPIPEHSKTHIGSAKTMMELQEHYRGNDKVQFVFLDNTSGVRGEVSIVEPANSSEFLKSFNFEDLNTRLKEVLDAEYKAGRINEKIYRGTAHTLAGGTGEEAGGSRAIEPAEGGRRGEAGAAAPREEVDFKAKPGPDDQLLVFRLGSEAGGLENRNAGNADAIGLFLRRLDDIDAPQPAGRAGGGGQVITAYQVKSPGGYGLYSTFDQGTAKRPSNLPGRRAAGINGKGIEYSFPKDTGWEAQPVASVTLEEVRAALKQISEFDNFDDAGGALAAKALRRAFASKLPTPEAPAAMQGAAESPPPRGQARAEAAGAEGTQRGFKLDPEAVFAPGSRAQSLPTVEILREAQELVGAERFQQLVNEAIAAENKFRAEASPGRAMNELDLAMEVEHVGRQIVAWADDSMGAAGTAKVEDIEAVKADPAPPAPGKKFLVLRAANSKQQTLANSNAGNIRSVAGYLGDIDNYEKPQHGATPADVLQVYEVTAPRQWGDYEEVIGGRNRLPGSGEGVAGFGRSVSKQGGVLYSFPADVEARLVSSVPLDDLRAALKEPEGGSKNFDYVGGLEVERVISEALTQPAAALKGPEGSAGKALTERGTEIQVKWRLVEAQDLVTSHDDALKPRPDYPAEVQPRERGRAASEAQIASIENNIRPELLGENPKASDGAPIVGPDGVVESGNARTIALRRAYGSEKAAKYKAWLAANAENFGLKPADVAGMKQPVLVRERISDVDRAAFAREANESSVAMMGAAETARSDVARMPQLDQLVSNDDGSINVKASMGFIRDFMESVPPSERPILMTADGSLSQAGLTRIRNAVFQRAYGDTDLVGMMAESTDANIKNVLAAMMRAAPDVAKLDELVQAGARYATNFPKDLAQAVRQYSQLRADGMPVKTFLAQGQMFDTGLSPAVTKLLQVLDENSRAPNRMVAAIQAELDIAHGRGNPQQAGLFEEPGDAAKGPDPLQLQAEKIALEQPDMKIRVGTDSNGNPITKTVKEFLDDATTAANDARQDSGLFEMAARCLVGAGS